MAPALRWILEMPLVDREREIGARNLAVRRRSKRRRSGMKGPNAVNLAKSQQTEIAQPFLGHFDQKFPFGTVLTLFRSGA
jgi:hypothetical protein